VFKFRLELEDGTAAEPAALTFAIPSWSPGDRVFVRPGLTYVVVATREGVLVVERE